MWKFDTPVGVKIYPADTPIGVNIHPTDPTPYPFRVEVPKRVNTQARRLTCNRRLEASIVVNSNLVEDIVLTIVDVVVLVVRTSYQCTVKDLRVRTIEVIVVPVAWSRKVGAGTESETENESETESENENGGESETMPFIFRLQ